MTVGIAALAVTLAPGGYLTQVAEAVSQSAPYKRAFAPSTSAPVPWTQVAALNSFDIVTHSRAYHFGYPSIPAQHGSDCSAPPATHLNNGSVENVVFQCRDHIMTSFLDDNYGAVYLTPNQLADWSGGEAVIKWDVSTQRTSDRDWWDVWVTPYESNLVYPVEDFYPDGEGLPTAGLMVRLDGYPGNNMLEGFTLANGTENEIAGPLARENFVPYVPESPTVRTTFELHVSRNHIKFGIPSQPQNPKVPAGGFWAIDNDIAPLSFTQGVIQFGHHEYNPGKDCPTDGGCRDGAFSTTWHWNNFSMSSAVPFNLLRANERRAYGDENQPGTFTFPQAAPGNAFLRFEALSGSPLEVSFDGGLSWTKAKVQPSSNAGKPGNSFDDGAYTSYFTPVPAGTTRVHLRGVGGWWGYLDGATNWPSPPSVAWIARSASIWAR